MTEYKSKVKYEPPVELVFDEPIWDEMDRAIEKNVANINERVLAASVSACMRVGVKVDKEELIKALRYDRGQYEKGYHDGIRDSAGELQYFKQRICEFCGIPHADGVDPDNCEIAGHAFCNQCRQGEHDCEKCNYIVAQGYMYKSPTIVPAEAERSGE